MRIKICVVLLLLCNIAYSGELLEGHVKKVIDGDTIVVKVKKKSIKIRLYGIDTPEKKQEYGKKATKALKKLLSNKTVQVYVVDKDRYGRSVGKVFSKGEYVNAALVREGAAWWYKKYAKKDIDLEIAEKWARQNKIGLWKSENPIAPWKYRKKK